MELWIRSQDRTKLVKCNDIVLETETDDGKTISGYKIIGYFDKETEYEELGFYTSYQNALDVLDKIQKAIFSNIVVNIYSQIGDMEYANRQDFFLTPVYEMPK